MKIIYDSVNDSKFKRYKKYVKKLGLFNVPIESIRKESSYFNTIISLNSIKNQHKYLKGE